MIGPVIGSFRDKDTEAIWQRRHVKKLSSELSRLADDTLVLINAAESINDRWRICSTWSTSGAGNVELVDYR